MHVECGKYANLKSYTSSAQQEPPLLVLSMDNSRSIMASPHAPIHASLPFNIPYFFAGNFGCPILSPLNITFSTLSIFPSTFWSGVAVPRSKSATIVAMCSYKLVDDHCVPIPAARAAASVTLRCCGPFSCRRRSHGLPKVLLQGWHLFLPSLFALSLHVF